MAMAKTISQIDTHVTKVRHELQTLLDKVIRHLADLERDVSALRVDVDKLRRANADPR